MQVREICLAGIYTILDMPPEILFVRNEEEDKEGQSDSYSAYVI